MNSAKRAVELISSIPWVDGELLRIFWIRVEEGSRVDFATVMKRMALNEGLVPIVIRDAVFLSANSVLSDINRLLDGNRTEFESALQNKLTQRVSVALLARDEFRLPQISSPVTLPKWFPGIGGREIFVRLSDLESQAEVDLLSSEEACTQQISTFLVDLEMALVERVVRLKEAGQRLPELIAVLNATGKDPMPDLQTAVNLFRTHLAGISDRRAYRPSLKAGGSIVGRLIRLVLKSSPDQLASLAKSLAVGLQIRSVIVAKPPLFAVLLRPTVKMDEATKNMHSLLLAVYEAYQFLTGAAHAGDYPAYSVALVRATSVDIRRSLGALIVSVQQD